MKMMDNNEQSIYARLQSISNTLLINGGFLPNLGLYSGDMGVVLFFYRYARLTQNGIYSEYSSDLLKKIQKKLHQFSPVNYKQGLTGIGSTIEYLAQNGYLEINTDDMLEGCKIKYFVQKDTLLVDILDKVSTQTDCKTALSPSTALKRAQLEIY